MSNFFLQFVYVKHMYVYLVVYFKVCICVLFGYVIIIDMDTFGLYLLEVFFSYNITYVPLIGWCAPSDSLHLYKYNIIHTYCVNVTIHLIMCSSCDWIILSLPMYITSLFPLTYVVWCTYFHWPILLPIYIRSSCLATQFWYYSSTIII